MFAVLGGPDGCAWGASPLLRTYYKRPTRHAPLARPSGRAGVHQTLDASGRDDTGTVRARPPNPLTGPFYVEGAEPGDGLIVRFSRVRMNRNWGFSSYRLGLYSITPESIEGIYPNRYKPGEIITERVNVVPWDLDLARQTVRLREPSSAVHKMEFAAKPMLGCVGVAPAGDFAPTSSPAGPYGGNLDYNEIVEGASVILPVYHPGALLFIGDGHALQADGEPTGTGIETSMAVELPPRAPQEIEPYGLGATSEHTQHRKPARSPARRTRSTDGDSDLVNWRRGVQMEPGLRWLMVQGQDTRQRGGRVTEDPRSTPQHADGLA